MDVLNVRQDLQIPVLSSKPPLLTYRLPTNDPMPFCSVSSVVLFLDRFPLILCRLHSSGLTVIGTCHHCHHYRDLPCYINPLSRSGCETMTLYVRIAPGIWDRGTNHPSHGASNISTPVLEGAVGRSTL